jgi:hypothetical protein
MHRANCVSVERILSLVMEARQGSMVDRLASQQAAAAAAAAAAATPVTADVGASDGAEKEGKDKDKDKDKDSTKVSWRTIFKKPKIRTQVLAFMDRYVVKTGILMLRVGMGGGSSAKSTGNDDDDDGDDRGRDRSLVRNNVNLVVYRLRPSEWRGIVFRGARHNPKFYRCTVGACMSEEDYQSVVNRELDPLCFSLETLHVSVLEIGGGRTDSKHYIPSLDETPLSTEIALSAGAVRAMTKHKKTRRRRRKAPGGDAASAGPAIVLGRSTGARAPSAATNALSLLRNDAYTSVCPLVQFFRADPNLTMLRRITVASETARLAVTQLFFDMDVSSQVTYESLDPYAYLSRHSLSL